MDSMKHGGTRALSQRAAGLLERYKYALAVILVGAALLLWPGERAVQPASGGAQAAQAGEGFDLADTEERMAQALSDIQGAGQVRVLLSVKSSTRNVLAEDSDRSDQNGGSQQRLETVVISAGSAGQSAVLVEQIYPEYLGALVVCTGGDEAGVRLKMVEAVSALTGLGADKICICKGK